MRITVKLLLLTVNILAAFAQNSQGIKNSDYNWSVVDDLLQDGVYTQTFPGCVALVGNQQGIIYFQATGNFTYGVSPPQNPGQNPPMQLNTIFDLASLTKVTGATNAIAQFYQRGEIKLDTKVSDVLGQEYSQNGKQDITILNLLLHNSGYPPDPAPGYWEKSFPCPENANLHPNEVFSCQQFVYQSLIAQTLMNPVGATYVYSDLNYITLMYVVGTLAKELSYVKPTDTIPECLKAVDPDHPAATQCYFEAYLRNYVFRPLGMKDTGFLPVPAVWPQCPPAENDTHYLHRVIQGQVSDENAYALGGIAGHAGLFSTAYDLHLLMNRLMFPSDNDSVFLNKTTVDLFTTEYNHTQSSRALGWNTNDPTVNDMGWNLSCGSMSADTFMHTGFAGTELCGDKKRKLYTILLTNRVYPFDNQKASATKIHEFRMAFNSAVVSIVNDD